MPARSSERWTRLAREARAAADKQRTTHSRRTMLELAEHFENLARRAVEKKARQVDAQPVIS